MLPVQWLPEGNGESLLGPSEWTNFSIQNWFYSGERLSSNISKKTLDDNEMTDKPRHIYYYCGETFVPQGAAKQVNISL